MGMEAEGAAWSPYLVGALIGVLSMATFYFSDKPLGVSTVVRAARGPHRQPVFQRAHRDAQVLPGQEAEDRVGGDAHVRRHPRRFPRGVHGRRDHRHVGACALGRSVSARSALLRSAVAFVGGAIMAYGARLAGGCTSGHGISGALQLSVSSWIALACFFAAAVATAMLLYAF